MNVLFVEQLRRHWQPLLAVLITVLFSFGHLVVFLPARARLERAMKQAQALGVAFDPESPQATMPPRVVGLIAGNALPRSQAMERGASGVLTADLFDQLTDIANRTGVGIIATEPGLTAQQEKAVLVKAHVRADCNYGQFVRFLDALARSDRLIAVDRFVLSQQPSGRQQLDLWVTRYVLKQSAEGR